MMASRIPRRPAAAASGKPLDLAESVAGEEDPGAAVDLPVAAATPGRPGLMFHYSAQVVWQRDGGDFAGNHYSRRHLIRFDGGAELMGSSSPHVVPVPQSDPAGVDPEEAFVASLSSCHMLWFLSIAARAGYCVDSYTDNAQGVMARNESGKMAMTQVTLRPHAIFSGPTRPSREELDRIHHEAHAECFIANSVTTDVRCEPVDA